jgi:battenin
LFLFFCGGDHPIDQASLLALAGKVDGITSIAHNTSSRTEERKHEVGEVRTTDDTSVLMASDPATENQDLQTSNVDDPDRTPPTQSDKGCCLTSFSSGTGAAGVFGFCWIWFFNDFIGLSLSATMWLALLSLPLSYWGTFSFVLSWQRQYEEQQGWRPQDITEENSQGGSYHDEIIDGDESVVIALNKTGENIAINAAMGSDQDLTESHDSDDSSGDLQGQNLFEVHEMTTKQRFDFVVTELWPYMTPLFVVYVAEYSLQSGTWTAIGFPSVQDRDARSRFFVFSNWMYQLGVFVSRSSGTLFTAPMSVLWLMPMLQVANVFLYWHVAATARDDYDSNGAKYNDLGFMYQSSFLYAGALYAGLLGGAVYVHGYKRICKDLPLQYREFALAATSFAECLGIVIADVLGLIIQSCLYKIHGLQNEAVLRCPV